MNRFAVVLLVMLGIAADVRAQGVAGAVRDLLDSDDWASLRVAGEHVHAAEDVAEVYRTRDYAPIWTPRPDGLQQLLTHRRVNDALLHAPGRASRRCFSAE